MKFINSLLISAFFFTFPSHALDCSNLKVPGKWLLKKSSPDASRTRDDESEISYWAGVLKSAETASTSTWWQGGVVTTTYALFVFYPEQCMYSQQTDYISKKYLQSGDRRGAAVQSEPRFFKIIKIVEPLGFEAVSCEDYLCQKLDKADRVQYLRKTKQ